MHFLPLKYVNNFVTNGIMVFHILLFFFCVCQIFPFCFVLFLIFNMTIFHFPNVLTKLFFIYLKKKKWYGILLDVRFLNFLVFQWHNISLSFYFSNLYRPSMLMIDKMFIYFVGSCLSPPFSRCFCPTFNVDNMWVSYF